MAFAPESPWHEPPHSIDLSASPSPPGLPVEIPDESNSNTMTKISLRRIQSLLDTNESATPEPPIRIIRMAKIIPAVVAGPGVSIESSTARVADSSS